MKKFLLSFFLIIGATLLAGCSVSNPINYVNTNISSIFTTVLYDDKNLIQIGVNSELDKESFKNEIEKLSKQHMNQITVKYRKVLEELANQEIITANERIFYKNHIEIYTGWDNEVFVSELRFHSATASRIFIKYCGEMDLEVRNGLFTTKVLETTTNLMEHFPNYSNSASATEYYNLNLKDYFIESENILTEEFKGVDVNYMFMSTNKKLYSNGITLGTSEGVAHYFSDDLNGNSFIFYRVAANRYVWYLFAFTITMSFIAISLVVIYFKKDNIQKKNQKKSLRD